MPKMRGVQLIRKIRAVRPSIRTVVCTGHSDALTAETAAREDDAGPPHVSAHKLRAPAEVTVLEA